MKLERRRRGDAERKVERASNVGSCGGGRRLTGWWGGFRLGRGRTMVGIRASTPTTKNEATTQWMNELVCLLTWFLCCVCCRSSCDVRQQNKRIAGNGGGCSSAAQICAFVQCRPITRGPECGLERVNGMCRKI